MKTNNIIFFVTNIVKDIVFFIIVIIVGDIIQRLGSKINVLIFFIKNNEERNKTKEKDKVAT